MPCTQRINKSNAIDLIFFIFGFLTPISKIFQLYYDDHFKWWKKLMYPERTTDNGQATGKLYHLRLRVECILFVIYKAVLVIGLNELLSNRTN